METICTWDDIITDYKLAKEYLYGPKSPGGGHWHRDEDNGYYFLRKAHHFATLQEQKNHLWYARILYTMANESGYHRRKFEILRDYMEPCVREYDLAKEEGTLVDKYERLIAKAQYDELLYIVQNSTSDEAVARAYSLLDMLPDNVDFSYHDSVVTNLSYDDKTYIVDMTLDYYGTQVSFRFEDVEEFTVHGVSPGLTDIFDTHCYRAYKSTDLIFDTGCYIIRCGKISMVGYKIKEE